MYVEVLSIGYWLTQAAASAPLLGTLIVGLVICHRQRRRRPRVSKLLGWALLAELIWLTLGAAAQTALVVWLSPEAEVISNETTDHTAWMLQLILWSLPGSTIHAAIWGTVLWAVLSVDDWQGETTRL